MLLADNCIHVLNVFLNLMSTAFILGTFGSLMVGTIALETGHRLLCASRFPVVPMTNGIGGAIAIAVEIASCSFNCYCCQGWMDDGHSG